MISQATAIWILVTFVLVCWIILTNTVLFLTGLGQRVWRRWRTRWQYKKGKHVNALFFTNNGIADEKFIKKEDDGTFKIFDQPYSANKKATFLFDGIPTQINFEGTAEPFDILKQDMNEKMSTSELNHIIMNSNVLDFIKEMKKWRLIFIIFVAIMVIFTGVVGYFSFQNYSMAHQLIQNGASLVQSNPLLGQLLQNATTVVGK